MIHLAWYESPIGLLEIGCNDHAVVRIRTAERQDGDDRQTLRFAAERKAGDDTPFPLLAEERRHGDPACSSLSELAYRQLCENLDGRRRSFDVPTEFIGTPFQQQVWQALCQIPYGETRTYGEIARMLGRPNASRAVGAANGRNPLWIVVPCHRVVGVDGRLVGYAGGLAMKKTLLALEREHAASSAT